MNNSILIAFSTISSKNISFANMMLYIENKIIIPDVIIGSFVPFLITLCFVIKKYDNKMIKFIVKLTVNVTLVPSKFANK